MARFVGGSNVDNDFVGTDGVSDVFTFKPGDLDSGDTVVGGDGGVSDILVVSAPGTIDASAFDNVSGIERISLAAGANTLTLTDALAATAATPRLTVVGNSGDDVVDGSAVGAGHGLSIVAGAGDDTLTGGAGDDLFRFALDALDISDRVAGREGDDALVLTTAGTLDAANLAGVSGVDRIVLGVGTNAFAVTDAVVESTDAGVLNIAGRSGDDTVDASGLTSANAIVVTAGAGIDTLTGGAGADRFRFNVKNLSGDTVVGGDGPAIDTLVFTDPGAISAHALRNVSGIERIALSGDGNNSILLTDALVSTAADARVQVIGGAGDDLVYGASLTGENALDIAAGGGSDTLIGGDGSDTFRFTGDALDDSDTVVGGDGGGIDQLVLTGPGVVTADDLAGVVGIEQVTLRGAGVEIHLTEDMFASAADNELGVTGSDGDDIIDAGALYDTGRQSDRASSDAAPGGGDSFSGLLFVSGGAGDDVITGGDTTNVIDGGAGADTIDVAGGDSSVLYDGGDVEEIVGGGTLYVRGAADIDLTQANDQSLDDTAVLQGFDTVDASASTVAVTLTGDSDNTLIGGSGDDTITGGQIIEGGRGADTLVGDPGSTVFLIAPGDFAAGESIDATAGTYDQILVAGSTDFTAGTMTGVEVLQVVQNPYTAPDTTYIELTGTEAASLSGTVFQRFTAAASLIVGIQVENGDPLDLSQLYFGDPGPAGALRILGTSADDTITGPALGAGGTIHGYGGDDVLAGTGTVAGDDGNDHIAYSLLGNPAAILNGGTGIDTLVGDPSLYGNGAAITLQLGTLSDQSIGDNTIVRGFENVDFSNTAGFALNVTGSSGANLIVGDDMADTLAGGAGDDILDGGSAAAPLSQTHGAADTLTGGAGADQFRWLARDGGMDLVTDFTPGEDRLVFAAAQFDFNGPDFDTLIVAQNQNVDIGGADLVNYTGGPLDSAADVATYLSGATGGSVDEGLFILGTDSAGDAVLYHALDASFTDSQDVAAVAVFGSADAKAIGLSSFQFV